MWIYKKIWRDGTERSHIPCPQFLLLTSYTIWYISHNETPTSTLLTVYSSFYFISAMNWILYPLSPTQIHMWKHKSLLWWYLEVGDSGSWSGREGRALINGTGALIRRDTREMISLSIMWKHSKKLAVGKPDRGLSPRTKPHWHSDLRFPSSRTVRNKCCLSHPVYGELLKSEMTNSFSLTSFFYSESYQDPTLHLVVKSPQPPLVWDNFPDFPCFWWLWWFWGVQAWHFTDSLSILVWSFFHD